MSNYLLYSSLLSFVLLTGTLFASLYCIGSIPKLEISHKNFNPLYLLKFSVIFLLIFSVLQGFFSQIPFLSTIALIAMLSIALKRELATTPTQTIVIIGTFIILMSLVSFIQQNVIEPILFRNDPMYQLQQLLKDPNSPVPMIDQTESSDLNGSEEDINDPSFQPSEFNPEDFEGTPVEPGRLTPPQD